MHRLLCPTVALLLSLALLVREVIGVGDDDIQSFPFTKQLPVLLVTGGGILLLEFIGMYVTACLMMLVITFGYSGITDLKKRSIHSLLFAVGFSAVMYLLFTVMLNVQLPRGLLM